MRTFVTIFTVVVHLVLLDEIAKEVAAATLNGSAAVSVIPGLFNLAYVENRGCAWGLFQGHVWPLAAFAIIAFAALVWKRVSVFGLAEKGWRLWSGRIAECLLYAGIIGNLIDRVYRGYVIDFLDFYWRNSHFPCFNLADAFISVAAGLLVVTSFFTRKTEK